MSNFKIQGGLGPFRPSCNAH